jgi:galactose-1-phosphate uridylyltransferase
MKSLIFATTFLLICHHGVAQMNNNTVMVRVTETWVRYMPSGIGSSFDTQIYVSFPNGEIKEKNLSDKGVKNFAENTKKIHEALDMFFSDRYELVSEQSTGGDLVNNYIWIFREVK